MPYSNQRVKRNSMVDMLTKVPVHRGSLLKSIENLLKTIESSESAVMIPTLLRDKCEFDAWELLFVAKILKASILGHIDLVEFYMNHIGLNAGQFTQSQTQNGTTPTTTEPQKASTPNTEQLSPSAVRMGSTSNGTTSQEHLPTSTTSTTSASTAVHTSNSTSTSSLSTALSAAAAAASSSNGTSNGHSKSSTTASWTSAASQQTPSSSPSAPSSLSSVATSDGPVAFAPDQPAADPAAITSGEPLLTAAPRVQVPLNQRPSLLQLTTTNNHINSVAAVAANLANQSPTLDHLTNQLLNLQQTQQQQHQQQPASPKDLGAHLSISTGANQPLLSNSNGATANGHLGSPSSVTPGRQPSELRSSRSAGCLFRLNSGASSPRTPTTPGAYPQAETLANGLPGGKFPGDPSAPVKLLLQIEQLKASIGHVTSLLESVVELYKKSIDTLA